MAKEFPSDLKTPEQKQKRTQAPPKEADELSLRGTLASVLILGGLIILCWAGAFYLYLDRL